MDYSQQVNVFLRIHIHTHTRSKLKWHHWNCFVVIIANPVQISQPVAVSPCWLQADKCWHGRQFLALEIKPNLCILTVQSNQYRTVTPKFTYPKFDLKSLQNLHSHPSGSHLLILFLKSSNQTFEANLIEFRQYLVLFPKFLRKSDWVFKLYFINLK